MEPSTQHEKTETLKQFDAPRLFDFYDGLRDRIERAVRRRGGRWGEGAARALLLAPDVFVLLARLALDPVTPKETRRLVGGALLYFLLPVDLFPEAVFGAAGFLDDVVLASIVLSAAMRPELEPLVERHWSGSGRALTVVADVSKSAVALLGVNLYARLERLLARRGIKVKMQPDLG